MPSTFFGLNIAKSGVNAYQASINTTANNISNVNTEGYSRQTTNLVATSALRVYSSYGSVSTGVNVDSVTRDRNEYYDTKFWQNQSAFGLYETKLDHLKRIENYFIDDPEQGQIGFSTVFDRMFAALDDMKNHAGDKDYRTQFIASAGNLCNYFGSVANSLHEQQIAINDEIKTVVDNINALTQKVSVLTSEINVIEAQNGNANELRDQRELLIDQLSYYIPVEVSENPVPDKRTGEPSNTHTYVVKTNGQTLVDTKLFNQLEVRPKENKANQSDAEGLYEIVWATTKTHFDANSGNNSGVLKGLFDVRDGNNGSYVYGTVQEVNRDKITIDVGQGSIDDPIKMNLPPSGEVTVNGKRFEYESFEAITDKRKTKEGNEEVYITGYKFTLKEALSTEEAGKVAGRTLEVGEKVPTMGIPYYQNQLNEFLRSFTRAFNDIEKQGETLDGDLMDSFFIAKLITKDKDEKECLFGDEPKVNTDPAVTSPTTGNITSNNNSYYQMTAFNVGIRKESQTTYGAYFACAYAKDVTGQGVDAYRLADDLLKLQSDTALFRGTKASSFLQCVYSDITVDTQKAQIFYDNYSALKETITNQRDSVSSVDTDDEAMDLVKFQNAYNLSCKVISTLQQMYDQLILNTGV